eukprot:2223114-Alexandrium_andersonii.AAC.1
MHLERGGLRNPRGPSDVACGAIKKMRTVLRLKMQSDKVGVHLNKIDPESCAYLAAVAREAFVELSVRLPEMLLREMK